MKQSDFIIRKSQISKELKSAFQTINGYPLMLHTDISRIGVIDSVKSRESSLNDYFSILLEILNGTPLLIPTFNYGFLKTGIYDVEHDPCEVGVLNEYFRKQFIAFRTQTPVFNFCLINAVDFSLEPANNMFGKTSTFAELVKNNGFVGFLGAPLSSNTFLHHVEERINVGYRYLKVFSGVIQNQEIKKPLKIAYRTHPFIDGEVKKYYFDWPRLERDLIQKGILKIFPIGLGKFLVYRAQDLLAYWQQQLENDELYLLSSQSRRLVNQLSEQYGYPLQCNVVEGTSLL